MGGGGAERQLAYLASALAAEGWETHVALTQGGPNMRMLVDAGVAVHDVRVAANHDPRLIVRLCQLIRTVQPDLVQCWLRQMEIAGGLAALVTRTPWIFSERCAELAYPRGIKTWLRIVSASFSNGIVSNSTGGDRYWETRVSAAVPRYVVQNAVPLDAIARVLAATEAELGIPAAVPLVLFAGRLHESKNPDALVRALRRLAPVRSFRSLFCGEGPMRAELEQLLRVNGLEQQVRVVGYVPNLMSLMKRASVFVSPTNVEGSPNVVLEAMACGCPLIVSDIDAHREILDEGSALFVDPHDDVALAAQIETVLADPVAASRRAERARLRAQEHALPTLATQYAAIYRDVLAHRVRRPREVTV
jgi:glycosyltransferase involved in cell wall biosynthesis